MTVYVDIPGFPGYKVSASGEVLNSRGKILLAKSRQLFLRVDGRQIAASRASLVLRAFVGPPGEGECALHQDDNQSNNVLGNLYWGTRTQNHKDAIRNGKLGRNSIQSEKIKKAWAEGRYVSKAETQRANNGGRYGREDHGVKVSQAWEEGKFSQVDWQKTVKKGWDTRRQKQQGV